MVALGACGGAFAEEDPDVTTAATELRQRGARPQPCPHPTAAALVCRPDGSAAGDPAELPRREAFGLHKARGPPLHPRAARVAADNEDAVAGQAEADAGVDELNAIQVWRAQPRPAVTVGGAKHEAVAGACLLQGSDGDLTSNEEWENHSREVNGIADGQERKDLRDGHLFGQGRHSSGEPMPRACRRGSSMAGSEAGSRR